MLTWSEFYNQFSIQLNEQQLSAVQSVTGPVLLLAVPGSGKTTVLVTRLGYMIFCRGIAPEKILTVTYTVAATKDMSERFASRFGQDLADHLEFRTINGICARVIQYYGRKTARTAFSLLTDEKRISAILFAIYQKTERVYPTEGDLKNVRTLITYIKNRMLNEKEIEALDETSEIRISAIYKEYCKHLRENQLMDYDDQMVYAYNMLRKIPWLLEYFQDQYPYICVDEAQDTSKIQHAIIALLASRTENLFMVGDEDQSIYGFRAAYPEALLEFEQHHPGANVLLMEENFRSDANIVQAADCFIQKNTLRHEKHMRPSRPKQRELLGYIPSGSTNDCAATLRIPQGYKPAAELAAGDTPPLKWDIGTLNDRPFVYVAAFGAFTEVAYDTPQELKNTFGHLAYVMAGIASLPSITPYHLKLEYDGQTIEDDFFYGMVCNTYSVGGIKNLPTDRVDLDDGLFEVILVRKPMNIFDIGAGLQALLRPGAVEESGALLSFHAARLRFLSEKPIPWTIDGEYGGSHEINEVRNRRQALSIIAGPDASK